MASKQHTVVTKETETVELPDPPKRYVEMVIQHPFSVKKITEEDWAKVGIEHAEVMWSRANGFRVPAEKFTLDEEQFARYIHGDPELRVAEVQE